MIALVSCAFVCKEPKFDFDINVSGTVNLLHLSVDCSVDKFVFAISCAVCGNSESLPVTEDARSNPISPYADSKLLGERYCLGLGERNLLQPMLRFFNVYGPRQTMNDYSGAIKRIINCAKKRLPLVIYGDGLQNRDFINLFDVVEGIVSSIYLKKPAYQIYNIATGMLTTISELAQAVSRAVGVDSNDCYKPQRLGDIRYSYADISRAKRYLNYSPQISLSEDLRPPN